MVQRIAIPPIEEAMIMRIIIVVLLTWAAPVGLGISVEAASTVANWVIVGFATTTDVDAGAGVVISA
jgi:hypothetical protein